MPLIAPIGEFPTQSRWIVDASKLVHPNDEYTFGVAVSGSDPDDTRYAMAMLGITPVPGNPPQGTLSRFCGYAADGYTALTCPATHNPSAQLTIVLLLDPEFYDADVAWSLLLDSGDTVELVDSPGIGVWRTTLSSEDHMRIAHLGPNAICIHALT